MPIKRVLTHGEKAAAYMADGYARASGRPGICAAQAVGAANLAAGLRDAYMGAQPGDRADRRAAGPPEAQSELSGSRRLSRRSTKSPRRISRSIRGPASRPAAAGVSRSHLRHARPGESAARGKGRRHRSAMRRTWNLIAEESSTRVPAHRPAPEAARIAEAVRILKAGAAARDRRGRRRAMVRGRTRSPETCRNTFDSRGDFAQRLFAGAGQSSALYRRSGNVFALLHEQNPARAPIWSLFIGSQTGGQVTHFWKFPPAGTPVIQIGIDPSDLGRNYPNRVSLLGDAKVTLQSCCKPSQLTPARTPAEIPGPRKQKKQ